MNVVYEYLGQSIRNERTGVGLGNFDGLHVGHATLIRTLVQECGKEGLRSVVYTFTRHPENILRKALLTPLLTVVEKKIELLENMKLDTLYLGEFDEIFSRMEPEAFVKSILVDRLGIRLAVVGYDYRFGYMGRGDVDLLEELGRQHGFRVIVIPPVRVGESVVSSTLIRQKLHEGNVEEAARLLGRPYSLRGPVVHGRNVGKTLGFPTANMQIESELIIPGKGVYVTQTLFDGKLYNSITNVGSNPTFGLDTINVETNLLDFDGDMYDKKIEVFFHMRIRGEVRFRSREELTAQITRDSMTAREYFRTCSCDT